VSRLHAVFLSLSAAAALTAGTVALAQTLHLGAASAKTSNRLLLSRSRQLDRFEASLHAALGRTPPPLPPVPVVKAPVVKPPPPVTLPPPPAAPITVAPAPSPPPPPVTALTLAPNPALVAAKTPRVIYKRPPPIIIHLHKQSGDGQDSQQPGGDGGDGSGD
jgi:hypothetical protein